MTENRQPQSVADGDDEKRVKLPGIAPPIHTDNCTIGGGRCVNGHCPRCGEGVSVMGHDCDGPYDGIPLMPPSSPSVADGGGDERVSDSLDTDLFCSQHGEQAHESCGECRARSEATTLRSKLGAAEERFARQYADVQTELAAAEKRAEEAEAERDDLQARLSSAESVMSRQSVADPPQGDTPDCNCASNGMIEGYRHGDGCPYGRMRRKVETAQLDEERRERETGLLAPEGWEGHPRAADGGGDERPDVYQVEVVLTPEQYDEWRDTVARSEGTTLRGQLERAKATLQWIAQYPPGSSPPPGTSVAEQARFALDVLKEGRGT